MPTIEENRYQQSPLAADLRAGVENLAQTQTVTFTKYAKVILPLDGFVFWVKADLLTASALANAARFNTWRPGQPQTVLTTAATISARGSLHFSSQQRQEEAETFTLDRVTFTSEDPINEDFNQVGPNVIFIGEFDDPRNPPETIKFAFSSRDNFYKQAGLYHYVGDAVYPFMQTQLIGSLQALDTHSLVVSNSLPLWLSLNNYTPFYGFGNALPLYPSHLLQPNIPPPFATVHIYPESTACIASAPFISFMSSHYQLVRERVKIAIYGNRNDYVMNFVDCVNQYSVDYSGLGGFGILNVPVIRDEKVGQNELSIIAQKKCIEYEISYHQNSVRTIARQIIGQAIVGYQQQFTIQPMNPIIDTTDSSYIYGP